MERRESGRKGGRTPGVSRQSDSPPARTVTPMQSSKRTAYLLRLTPQERAALFEQAEQAGVTVRAYVLSRTLGIPLDHPTLDSKPGRKVAPQEALPMSA